MEKKNREKKIGIFVIAAYCRAADDCAGIPTAFSGARTGPLCQEQNPHALVKKMKKKWRKKRLFCFLIFFWTVFFFLEKMEKKNWRKKLEKKFGIFPWLNRVGGSEPPGPNLRAARSESPDPSPQQFHYSHCYQNYNADMRRCMRSCLKLVPSFFSHWPVVPQLFFVKNVF